MLRIWKTGDFGVDDLVSKDSTFENPLSQTNINGDTGEVRNGDFYLALEQAKLAEAVTTTGQTTFKLDRPMFFTTAAKYPVIILGSEKCLITDGFGTDTLTVQRAWNGTIPSTYAIGEVVRSAYKATEIQISAYDSSTPPDESSWLKFRDYESGSYESPHSVPDIDYDESSHQQYQVVVPAWPASYKNDLKPRLTFKLTEIPNPGE